METRRLHIDRRRSARRCPHFHLSVGEMLSRKRRHYLAGAHQVAMYLKPRTRRRRLDEAAAPGGLVSAYQDGVRARGQARSIAAPRLINRRGKPDHAMVT